MGFFSFELKIALFFLIFLNLPLGNSSFITYITPVNGDVPKLVRGESAKLLFISSSLIVASKSKERSLGREVFFLYKKY